MHDLLLPLGGILAGSGVVSLIFGFQADTGAPAHTTFSELGFSAVRDWSVTGTGMLGIALILVGGALMVAANATAWRRTGGY